MSTKRSNEEFDDPNIKRPKSIKESDVNEELVLRRNREISLQRWRILKDAIVSGRSSALTSNSSASVRRFSSFGLLKTAFIPHLDNENRSDGDWYLYTAGGWPDFQMTIRHLPGIIKPETLLGFNNTGNVCVWPSEEILTFYCLQNKDLFSQKDVIELGGGMTCLAGVALSIETNIKSVVLTDGNEESVSNLDAIISKNTQQFGDTKVTSRLVRWGSTPIDGTELREGFDFVLCADCLFFDEGREDLVATIYKLLRPKGEAIMFAPKRGETFDACVSLARDRFNVEVKENYDSKVWSNHCRMEKRGIEHYDPNIHYPWYIRMKKLPESRENSSER